MTQKHIVLTIIILFIFIRIIPSNCLENIQFAVDFNKTTVTIEVERDDTVIIICPSPCLWLIPISHRGIYQFSTGNNLIIPKIYIDLDMKLRVCTSNADLVEYHNFRPDCCPCCQWYDALYCDIEPKINRNCTIIQIHVIKIMFYSILTYRNSQVLIPCDLNNKFFSDNNIDNGKILLEYRNNTWKSKNSNYTYDPNIGLCVQNNSFAETTFLSCHYNDSLNTKHYMIETKDTHKRLKAKFQLSLGETIFSPNNNTLVKLLNNTNFIVTCKISHFEVIACTKLYFENSTIPPYTCYRYYYMTMNISTNKLKNKTKLICFSKDAYEAETKIEIVLMKYSKSYFVLKQSDKWKNHSINVNKRTKYYYFAIEFDVVPSYDNVTCTTRNKSEYSFLKCQKEVMSCLCNYTISNFNHHYASISHVIILSNKIKEYRINVTFVPIFINTPIIKNATPYIEQSKLINCTFFASKPYHIKWYIKLDKRKMIYANKTSLEIYFNQTIQYCIQCTVKNEAGTRKSDEICHKLIDPYINDNKTIEISFRDVYKWQHNELNRLKRLKFIGNNLDNISLIDHNLTVSCASRIVTRQFELLFNNLSLNLSSTNTTTTLYKKETTFLIQTNALINFDYNVNHKFKCRQILANNNIIEDETSKINILEMIIPKIIPAQERLIKFISGPNVMLEFKVFSFPASIFHCIDPNKENVINNSKIDMKFRQINRTLTRVKITIHKISSVEAGYYNLAAVNIAGSDLIEFQLLEYSKVNLSLIIIITVVLLIIVSMVIAWFIYRYFKPLKILTAVQYKNLNYRSVEMDQLNILSEIWPNDQDRFKWTLGHEFKFVVFDKIGSGNYGNVYKASIQRSNDTEKMFVALKEPILIRPKHGDINNQTNNSMIFCAISSKCFVNEVRIMSKLTNCANIVKLVGCTLSREQVSYDESSTVNPSEFNIESFTLLAMEYCDNQSLSEYIRKNSSKFAPFTKNRQMTVSNENGSVGNRKIDQGLTLLDLKRISLGIANGIEYLSDLNIVHRDLATRNILIDNNRIPKITDFGLAIDLDENLNNGESYQILTTEKPLPLKILAPESLQTRSFYLESDIWSFSLLLWELFNLCHCELFPSISSTHQLRELINQNVNSDGYCPNLLQSPQFADQSVWEVIKSCWVYDYRRRPNAANIKEKLTQIIHQSPVEVVRVTSSPEPIAPLTLNDCLGYSGYQGSNPVMLRRHKSHNTTSSVMGENSSNILSTNTSIITLNYPSTTTSMVFNGNGNHSDRLYEEDESD